MVLLKKDHQFLLLVRTRHQEVFHKLVTGLYHPSRDRSCACYQSSVSPHCTEKYRVDLVSYKYTEAGAWISFK